MQHKDFTKKVTLYSNKKAQQTTSTSSNVNVIKKEQIPPENTTVFFPKNTTGRRGFDFSKFYGKNCDEIVFACQQQIQGVLDSSINTEGKSLSIATIVSQCREGISNFLRHCALIASSLGRPLLLTDIDKSLMDGFIGYLENSSIKYSTKKDYYSSIKQVLLGLMKKKKIAENIFHKNPYPNSNRTLNGETALSSQERSQLVYALKEELKILFDEHDKVLSSYDASICLLAIALRTGRNTTPLLELSVDCLQEHPLKPNRQLMVSYKRRGSSTHLTPLRTSKNIEMMTTTMPDVDIIVRNLIKLSRSKRKFAPQKYQQRLFLYEARRTTGTTQIGDVVPLTDYTLAEAIKKIIKKYAITNNEGTPLRLNVSRLRKTFVNRLWKLSGNDPFVTAKLAGHTLKVSNDHYLEISDEMVKNWQLMGEIRAAELLENKDDTAAKNSIENTPVGHCKDTRFGHLAPKNGEYCADFLGCFRCRSYVITSDDLYRLFSFYWLIVRERDHIGTRKWSRYYAHIIRIIDQQIAPQFDAKKVAENRILANENPHPFWRNREQIMESI